MNRSLICLTGITLLTSCSINYNSITTQEKQNYTRYWNIRIDYTYMYKHIPADFDPTIYIKINIFVFV